VSDLGVGRLFSALAERALGNEEEGVRLMSQWTQGASSVGARWLVSVFRNDAAGAGAAEKEMRGGSLASLLGRPAIDQALALTVEVRSLVTF
jgi:hypothetical protein